MKNRSIRSTQLASLPSSGSSVINTINSTTTNVDVATSKTNMRKSHKQDLKTYLSYYDNLIESRKSLIIKLKYPQMPVKEIYDLDYLQLDNDNRANTIDNDRSNSNVDANGCQLQRYNSTMCNGNYSSISSSSSNNNNNNNNVTSGTGSSANSCSSVSSSLYSMSQSTRLSNGNNYDGYRFKPSSPSSLTNSSSSSSSSSSASSTTSYSNRASFDSNDFKLSINNNMSGSSTNEHFITSPPPPPPSQQPPRSASRQPAQFARHNTFNSQHESINNFGYDDSNDESFTFKDFVSSIINNPNEELHVMIIQDIARLLELKFRDFVKSISKTNLLRKRSNQDHNSNNNNNNNSQIYLNGDSNLFTQIGENIFKQALEEPNGILGARLKLRFQLLDGRTFDCCESFAYDSTTMPTSELIVILKEQLTETRKFLNRFRFLAASFEKYCSTHVDTSNYDIIKNRLY